MQLSRAVPLAATFIALSLSLQQPPAPASDTSAPGTAAIERPNIVVIMTDDQDIESLPAMRKLMAYPQGSWINFTNTFANDSVCCPSRATLLTGQYSHRHGVTTNALAFKMNDAHTLPVWLDNAGYNTAIIGKYLNNWRRNRPRGYRPPGWDTFSVKDNIDNVDTVTQMAVDYLKAARPPYFLYLSYAAPHAPAKPPARYANANVFTPPVRPNVNEADVSDKPHWVRKFPLLTPEVLTQWRAEQVNSQREVLALDDGVESVIAALKTTGQLNNTLVIFIGDNGMSWGSHRKIGKWCPYEECSRVPLFIRYPGQAGNRTEAHFVSNADLTATIAAYAGVTPTIPQDGRSLIPLLQNPAGPWRDSVLLERHVADDYFGIRLPGWTYLEYESGYKELYDLAADPYQMQNVARMPAYQAKVAELAGQLHALLGQQ
jgi:arylsulfatase A-like enzyme